jgi:NAD(P)-dependent dehydrogenase (short-subunit alcohol dehydrogenase family)
MRIVVVGGASGIGLACVELLAKRGADVVVASRNPERARAQVASLGEVSFVPLDALDRGAVERFFLQLGVVDHVVVTMAGGAYIGPFTAMMDAGLVRSIDGKLRPYLNVIAAAIPALSANGSITVVTGLAARRAAPGAASLAIVNGALESLVITLAVEIAPRRVNAVSPGTTATSAWDRIPAEARRSLFDSAAARTPLGRIAAPGDVARAVAAIIDADFVTGAVLPVDGGAHVV